MAESHAYMTEAKKRRSEAEKARGFFKRGTDPVAREEKIKALKEKLPCKACGQLGNRKDDAVCPSNKSARRTHMVSTDLVGAEKGSPRGTRRIHHVSNHVSIFMAKAGNPDVVTDVALTMKMDTWWIRLHLAPRGEPFSAPTRTVDTM